MQLVLLIFKYMCQLGLNTTRIYAYTERKNQLSLINNKKGTYTKKNHNKKYRFVLKTCTIDQN